MDLTLVYLVAGISSRFNGKIKAFANVFKDKTLIEYSLDQALEFGFNKIVFVVSSKTEKHFRDFFGDSYKGIKVDYALQDFDINKRDKPWGTADALISAKDFIDGGFIVLNGDDIYGRSTFEILFNHLKNSNEDATTGFFLGDVIPENGDVNRGIFESENNYVTDIREEFSISKDNLNEKSLSNKSLCSLNIFALQHSTLEKLQKKINDFKENNKDSRTAECLLSSELGNMIKNKEISMKLYSSKDKWYGVTNPGDEILVKKELESSF